jgi:hypothetical protein
MHNISYIPQVFRFIPSADKTEPTFFRSFGGISFVPFTEEQELPFAYNPLLIAVLH